LLVDLDRMERNLDAVAAYCTAHDLSLRPHVKTHKTPWIAAAQLARGARGLTCATPREAETMAAVGDDLLVAYPTVGAARARRVAELPPSVRVTVALDSSAAVTALAEAARRAGRPVRVLVELDLGMHRVGLERLDDAVALAHLVHRTAPLEFAGILYYPGHVREAVQSQDEALDTLRVAVGSAVDTFTRAGLAPGVVSGGSTPTLWRSHEVTGTTEIRPGTYVFNDRTTAAIGACAWDDCALTVLATVVSTSVRGQAVIDAGTKALGREPLRGGDGAGYGALLDRPEVTVKQMSEEHGLLDLAGTDWVPRVGTLVRVVPNHVCIAVHLADTMHGMRGGQVESSWPIAARGRERTHG
ncbi:MAG TPA: alanine racemase, partial [Gemmatimonadaceae bacterium]|nr:alanine racemase [Gemmatimonadaceae bacterium]